MVEFLLLDFYRPEETKLCVKSIRSNTSFDYKIRLLHNGPAEEYHGDLLESGLINYLHTNDANLGCGMGTMQLFAYCKTKYAFYVQVDQILRSKITQDSIDFFIKYIEKNDRVKYVDLAGNQGHGQYSERAAFVPVDWYNNIRKSPGGPGPLSHITWTEQCVQEHMREKVETFASTHLFLDNGKFSVRSNPDGSIWRHRTDQKTLWCIKKPNEKYVYPKLNDDEWKEAIAGNWPKEGKIPEKQKKDSFIAWK